MQLADDALAARSVESRFERRILVREDVGRAFQQFVWEALSSTEFPDLVQHPVRGRDGGIDLIDQGDGRRTALECKFHSDARDDGPESDWRRVASVLKETLPELCGKEEAKVLTSPHAPWLDRQRAISAYWFCISTTFANESAVDRLKGEIERDSRRSPSCIRGWIIWLESSSRSAADSTLRAFSPGGRRCATDGSADFRLG